MMKIQYKNIFALSFVLLATALTGCSESELDKVNRDNDHPQDVTAEFILSDIETASAFSIAGGDLSTYASVYVEHETGTHNQLYNAQVREGEPSNSSTYNNSWLNVYSNIKNSRIVVEKSEAAGNDLLKGIGEVMLAYNSAILTDLWGDVPYTEAAQLADPVIANLNPKIDTQESIYATIDELLDAAIVDLQSSSLGKNPAAQDFIYNGSSSKWLKFAYGLKARYAMRRLARSTDVNADLAAVIDYCDMSFASADEQAEYAVYGSSILNPLFDFEWSRDAISASISMAHKLKADNDPRLNRVYYDPSSWAHQTIADGTTNFAPIEPEGQTQYTYTYSTYVFAQTAPTLLLSYHEVLFLKAEAQARLGLAEGKETLKAAVVAGMANSERSIEAAANAPTVVGYGGLAPNAPAITTEQTETWFDADIAPLYDGDSDADPDPVKAVMVQKYVSQWGASGEAIEAYNDIRRAKGMGEEYVELENTGALPLRFTYGSSDTTTNPNIKSVFGDGTYVYTNPVWWAGGND
ncbi:MAG: SusD/RagB family nutrient-binding outer membrane lipoprotein [Bacteroidaceae bacterium]